MGKTEVLRSLIFDQFHNVKEFSEAAGLPYTTVRSILSRGIENSSLDNVIKMCKTLGTTIDELLKEDGSYYVDPETALLAERAFRDPDTRILMSAKRDLSPESLKAVINMVKLLKSKERPQPEDYPDEPYPDDNNQEFPDD